MRWNLWFLIKGWLYIYFKVAKTPDFLVRVPSDLALDITQWCQPGQAALKRILLLPTHVRSRHQLQEHNQGFGGLEKTKTLLGSHLRMWRVTDICLFPHVLNLVSPPVKCCIKSCTSLRFSGCHCTSWEIYLLLLLYSLFKRHRCHLQPHTFAFSVICYQQV